MRAAAKASVSSGFSDAEMLQGRGLAGNSKELCALRQGRKQR